MDAIRRTSTLRRVATTASLTALLMAPTAADAAKGKRAAKPKSPVITGVAPMDASVGDTLTIKGRNFRKGKGKNSVGFKADGEAVVFVKAGVATPTTLYVKLPAKLESVMDGDATRFHLRVLAARFGKAFTGRGLSPTIAPAPADSVEPAVSPTATPDGYTPPLLVPTPVATATPAPACAAGTSDTVDTDKDGLSDKLENTIGTAGCKVDTDGDGVSDGYEYRSAIDLNDDEYQNPNQTLPYPGELSYPNPLSPENKGDAGVDYDGDGLTLLEEFRLWTATTPESQRTLADPTDGSATPLNYSDGLQYSRSHRCTTGDASPLCGSSATHAGRRVPSLAAANYDRWSNFTAWLASSGYQTVYLHDSGQWFDHTNGRHPYNILDVNRSGGAPDASEAFPLDRDQDTWLSDDERDEDADGLSNLTEAHVEMLPQYWAGCYSAEKAYLVAYTGTDLTKADTDGDGVRDGADDQDHDDVPNLMELSRYRASGYLDTEDYIKDQVSHVGSGPLCKADADLLQSKDNPNTPEDESAQPFPLNHEAVYGQVNPFNPCLPDTGSRNCAHFYPDSDFTAPFDESPHWWALQ